MLSCESCECCELRAEKRMVRKVKGENAASADAQACARLGPRGAGPTGATGCRSAHGTYPIRRSLASSHEETKQGCFVYGRIAKGVVGNDSGLTVPNERDRQARMKEKGHR